MKRLWDWFRRERGSAKAAPVTRLQPIILSSDSPLPHPRVQLEHDPVAIAAAESDMNVAMRSIVNVMAIEGLITREQAREFTDTHAVVVAYRARGLSGLLHGLGVGDADIKANRSRVVVVRLPVAGNYAKF